MRALDLELSGLKCCFLLTQATLGTCIKGKSVFKDFLREIFMITNYIYDNRFNAISRFYSFSIYEETETENCQQ